MKSFMCKAFNYLRVGSLCQIAFTFSTLTLQTSKFVGNWKLESFLKPSQALITQTITSTCQSVQVESQVRTNMKSFISARENSSRQQFHAIKAEALLWQLKYVIPKVISSALNCYETPSRLVIICRAYFRREMKQSSPEKKDVNKLSELLSSRSAALAAKAMGN